MRLIWQRKVSPISCTEDATMSDSPDFFSFTVVSARRLTPARLMSTTELDSPDDGLMLVSAIGGGGGSSAALPVSSSD
jgi:hypothetical protein